MLRRILASSGSVKLTTFHRGAELVLRTPRITLEACEAVPGIYRVYSLATPFHQQVRLAGFAV